MRDFGVSRETHRRLIEFQKLLERWNRHISLISPTALLQFKERHVPDAVYLASIPDRGATRWYDLGSGNGLPGIIISIVRPDCEVVLIEADQRKAAFLRSVSRDLELGCRIINRRIEAVSADGVEIVSAQALAPLPTLLHMAVPLSNKQTRFLFPKGEQFQRELDAAAVEWNYTLTLHPSISDPAAQILELSDVSPI